MINFYEFNLKTNYSKLGSDGLLFVEYQCMPGDVRTAIWSQHSYIAFIQSGSKTWITPEGEFPVNVGDAIFCKKGAHIVKNFYDEQFCALVFFIPDDFIRHVVIESQIEKANYYTQSAVIRVEVDLNLKIYFESMLSYFLQQHHPSEHLLKLKFKELILQVITGPGNLELRSHFFSLKREQTANLQQLMLDNYLFPLTQEDFARLTHRSLSSFKRDFQETFGVSLNKWLVDKRLKYAKSLLLATEETVNNIAYTSGFETTSNFIRCFKKQYDLPPQQFRQEYTRAYSLVG